MRLPLSWLEEYVPIEEKPDQLAQLLTLSGTKVEAVTNVGEDTLFEFEITPNRGDSLSVIGIAREIAALTGQPLKEVETTLAYLENQTATDQIKLQLKNPALCPHYALGVFDRVTVTKSSSKIADRLTKSGIRPLNSIVDVTNYVMLETGLPSHAFDYDKIISHKMTVRESVKAETVTTLDGVKRELPQGAIVIENNDQLIDLAGLMGGENSAIGAKTIKVALLVPIYNPINIRRTSLATNLRTEASNRFEKSLDPLAVKATFYRLAKLFFETSGARLSSEVSIVHSQPVPLRTIEITLTEIEDYLGITILGEDLVSTLTPLGFMVKHLPQEGSDKFAVTVPSFRNDINLPVDIIEEVARLFGYNKFPKTLPTGELPTHEDSFLPDWERLTKENLTAAGVNETLSYTLLSAEVIRKLGCDPDKTLRILNPNSEDFVYLRSALLPGLLTQVATNLTNFKEVSLFEIGKVFASSSKPLPDQNRQLGIITNQNFAYLKGVLSSLSSEVNLKLNFKKKDFAIFESGQAGEISGGKEVIGELGYLNPTLLANFDIDTPIVFASFDFEKLIKLGALEKVYTPLPKFPEVKEDLSLLLDRKVETQTIIDLIYKTGRPLLKVVTPIDQFSSPKLGEGKKSITFSLSYATNRTLTNLEVAKVREKISKELVKSFKAEIR